MLEHYEQYKFNKKGLKDENKKSMGEGKCQLKIVEIRNLPGNVANPQIKVFLQSAGALAPVGETQITTYDMPVFNKIVQFPVNNDE